MSEYIFLSKKHDRTFKRIIDGFPQKLKDFNPQKKAFQIRKYFDNGSGLKTAFKNLHEDGYLDKPGDFKEIYVFIKGRMPIYTGISKGVVKRIIQHTKGHSHHTSSFAYSLAKGAYQKQTGDYSRISRKAFNFREHVTPAKEFLLNQKIAFLEIKDDIELYLFELYCAMELKTLMYNSFSTH